MTFPPLPTVAKAAFVAGLTGYLGFVAGSLLFKTGIKLLVAAML